MFISKRGKEERGGPRAEFHRRSRTSCWEGGADPRASGPGEGGGRLMQGRGGGREGGVLSVAG